MEKLLFLAHKTIEELMSTRDNGMSNFKEYEKLVGKRVRLDFANQGSWVIDGIAQKVYWDDKHDICDINSPTLMISLLKDNGELESYPTGDFRITEI